MVESILSKREVALHNVQTILGQIQMAETDAMVSWDVCRYLYMVWMID